MSALEDRLARFEPLYRPPLPELPPGMMGGDLPLYAVWRRRPHVTAQVAFFNVRVGNPDPPRHQDAPLNERIAQALTSLRIDLLLRAGAVWWLVEFHSQAGLAQLGRLLAYPDLLRTTHPHDETVRPLLVAELCNPFLLPTWRRAGIPILTYPAPRFEPVVCDPQVAL